MKPVLPNFIIAGVHKAGTTSLFFWLMDHPEVICSLDKETNFFIYTKYKTPARPIEEYYAQWPKYNNQKLIMEASPGYFYGGAATATEIKNKCNNPKVLMVFRDPTDRLYSFFTRKKEVFQLPENTTLEEYIKKCESFTDEELVLEKNHIYTGMVFGHYIKHIDDWYNVTGNNLRVMFFEELREPKKVMKDLCVWLGINPDFYDTYNFDVKNKSGTYKNKLMHTIAVKMSFGMQRFWRSNPALKKRVRDFYYVLNRGSKKPATDDESAKNYLRQHFKPYNEKFATYLKTKGITDLPKWLS